MEPSGRPFALAMLFESSLGVVGLAMAWLVGISLTDRLQLTESAVERGLLATLPLLLMLGLLTLSNWPPIVEIIQQVEQLVSELFKRSHWLEVALISLAAGLGEELLFRGALQPWIASWTHPLIGLSVVSLLFGLAHAMSTSYFVVATLVGGYLGWLALAFEDLVAPIIAHATYDFVALRYFQWRVRKP